jgi:hypothetical protein
MKKASAVVAVGLLSFSLYGLPGYDPFADATGSGGTSYGIGANLVGQTNAQLFGWYQAGSAIPSSTIQGGNLTIGGLMPPSGNSVSLVPQANVASRFAFGSTINSGSLYYSFALHVGDIGSTLGTGGGFFAGFNNTGGASQTTSPTIIGARVLIRSTAGGFNIGLSKSSSTGSDFQWGSQVFTTSDTIFIVGAYDFGTLSANSDDSSRLWINPNSSDFAAGTAPTATLTASSGVDVITTGSLQSFLLYERANTLFPNQMTLDELRIGTSWSDVTPIPEPATAALFGLSLLPIIFWRKLIRS